MVIAVGFILSQEEEDGKRYPNHFGSISLTSIESWYSQAKLELYRLFCSLQAVQVFIFGVTNLVVEMDAKYVKGMINNPDLQPNMTINWWIAGMYMYYYFILNFDTFPQTDTLVLMDYHIGHPQMIILQIQMILRIGWTNLTPFALPYSMISYCLLLPCHAPHIWGCVSLAYCPLSPRCRVASSCYPFLCHSLFSHICLSFTLPLLSLSLSQTLPLYVPRSTKTIARESRIHLIQGFLGTCAQSADLSDTEFHLFINSVTKFFLLHGSLWH